MTSRMLRTTIPPMARPTLTASMTRHPIPTVRPAANNGDSSGTMSADLKKALDDAAQAMKDSDAAMKKGDWSAYGDAQKQLQEALNKAIELEQ